MSCRCRKFPVMLPYNVCLYCRQKTICAITDCRKKAYGKGLLCRGCAVKSLKGRCSNEYLARFLAEADEAQAKVVLYHLSVQEVKKCLVELPPELTGVVCEYL